MRLFRTAPERSHLANILWTGVQCTFIWSMALVIGPALVVGLERAIGIPSFDFPARVGVGVALLVAFSALNMYTGAMLALRGRGTPLPIASPRQLVVAGPYRYIRNPMALAGIGQGFSVGVILGSWLVLLYAIAGAMVWHFIIRPAEERDLAFRFGASYDEYRRAVPLWVPTGSRVVRHAALGAIVLFIGADCGDPVAPPPSIAFLADNLTCIGSSPVDLFIDGAKVGSPTLSAGKTSEAFAVTAGTHVVSAKSLDSGTEWAETPVTVDGATVHTLTCSQARPLARFTATIRNRLIDSIVVTSGGVTDTVAGGTSKDWKFIGYTGFTWSPLPKRYGDGTPIPDDNLVARDTFLVSTTTEVTPFSAPNSFYTFSLTNTSGVPISIGVISGGTMRCLLNASSTNARYDFGYFRFVPGTEVRAHRGADCTGAYASWNYTQITPQRNPMSGYVTLLVLTPP